MRSVRDTSRQNRPNKGAVRARRVAPESAWIKVMYPPPPSDPQQLLTKARQDEPACLGRLLQFYYNYLRLLASTQIDTKLQARFSPSDVVQETFLEAHRDFGQFRGQTEAEFLAWLRRILANNLARQVERHVLTEKRDVRREISLNQSGAAIEESTTRLDQMLADQAKSPSADVARREYAVILADQLAAMPPDYREVIVLRHLRGLPFKEVAKQMDRAHGAVRMLWLRAVADLRERLVAEGLA